MQHDARAVDRACEPNVDASRSPTCATTNGTAASASDEHDPDQRLQQREHPPAHLVVDVGAQQRHAGQVGDAGAEADAEHEDHRERDLRHDRRSGSGRPRRRRCASPNSRRRDSSRAMRGPNAMPGAEPDEHRAEQHAVGGVAAAEAGDEDLAGADHRAAGDEGADQADDQPADQLASCGRTARPRACRDSSPGWSSPARPIAVPADLADEEHDDRAEQERRRR